MAGRKSAGGNQLCRAKLADCIAHLWETIYQLKKNYGCWEPKRDGNRFPARTAPETVLVRKARGQVLPWLQQKSGWEDCGPAACGIMRKNSMSRRSLRRERHRDRAGTWTVHQNNPAPDNILLPALMTLDYHGNVHCQPPCS